MHILVIEVANTRYGIAATWITEVLRAVAITPLPSAPGPVEGIIDVHGTLTPVVDLRRRLGLHSREIEPQEHLVVVRARGRQLAFRADRCLDMIELTPGDTVPSGEVTRAVPYVAGVAKTREGLVMIHDPAALLSEAEDEQLGRALRAAAAGFRS